MGEGKVAQNRRENDAAEAYHGQGAQAKATYKKGPYQIELFLYRERPERAIPLEIHILREVGEVEEAHQDVHPVEMFVEMKYQQGRYIKGQDPQDAPGVEALPIIGAVARVDEDAGDKEAGEDEEEVDPQPAGGSEDREDSRRGGER